MEEESRKFIESIISVWRHRPYLKGLSEVLEREKEKIVPHAAEILRQKKKGDRTKYDEARSFIINHVSGQYSIRPALRHLEEKDRETSEIIVEDSFYQHLLDNHTHEFSQIMIPCIQSNEQFIKFFIFFMEGWEEDITGRFKAMLWFASLLIQLTEKDREEVCDKEGTVYLKKKLKELLDCALKEEIIKETDEYDYDGGKWNETVFALLQGDDRKRFAETLIYRFNFDNNNEHSNRRLLEKHRTCMYQRTITVFCTERTV